MNSGIYDINGLEIKDGDELQITINPILGGPKIVNTGTVKFIRGAYRFIREGREGVAACIGDFSYNCDFLILHS